MSSEVIIVYDEVFNGRHFVGKLMQDEDCESPFDGDGMGTLHLFQRGHDEANRALIEQYANDPLAFRVECYEHGLVHYSIMNMQPYPDREWDVYFAGFFVPDKELLDTLESYKQKPWGEKKPDVWYKEEVANILEQYTSWCNGDCWGYVVEVDGEEVDSCWGYVGQEYAKEQLEAEYKGQKTMEEYQSPPETLAGNIHQLIQAYYAGEHDFDRITNLVAEINTLCEQDIQEKHE